MNSPTGVLSLDLIVTTPVCSLTSAVTPSGRFGFSPILYVVPSGAESDSFVSAVATTSNVGASVVTSSPGVIVCGLYEGSTSSAFFLSSFSFTRNESASNHSSPASLLTGS